MKTTQFASTLLLAALCLSIAIAKPVEMQAQWKVAIPLPKPTQEIYPALHNGALVVAGGINASTSNWEIHHQVWQWKTGQNEWTNLPSLPEPRHHGILVSYHGDLLLIGGFTTSEQGAWVNRKDVLVLDGDKWKHHSELPTPLSESNAAILNGQLHLAGGRSPNDKSNATWSDSTDVTTHYTFDEQRKQWFSDVSLSHERNSACSVVFADKWYVIGGRTVAGGNVAFNEVFDPVIKAWLPKAPMPQAQAGLACAVLGEHIYAFGGEFFDNGGGVYKEVWQYSPKTDSWRQMGDMPVPRHGLGAVTYNGSIAVIAGAAKVGGKDTSARVSLFSIEE